MRALLNQAALRFFQALPTRFMAHMLFLLRSNPEIPDRWGYHIRPIHYHEPIPDFRAITETRTKRRRDYQAIDFKWQEQLRLISHLGASYRVELEELAAQTRPDGFDFRNGYFSGFDAAIYYALIRYLKPARVIEIGGGYSTRIAHIALARNLRQGKPGKLTCIEPYPQPRLTEAGLEIELIPKPVETIKLEFFSCLSANDILFIDSSHTVKFGNDVCYEFLDILPRLKPGVWVHVHDIFFPHDYPADWLTKQRLALNEQYLFEAFLSYNSEFSVAVANHWIVLEYPNEAAHIWNAVTTDGSQSSPASFWIKRHN